jgi:hypothetical protein
MANRGVNFQFAEVAPKRNVFLITDRLIWKNQHKMLHPKRMQPA